MPAAPTAEACTTADDIQNAHLLGQLPVQCAARLGNDDNVIVVLEGAREADVQPETIEVLDLDFRLGAVDGLGR